jgi:hypothetical protein
MMTQEKTSLFSQVTDRVLKRRRGRENPVSQVYTSLPIVFITVESFNVIKKYVVFAKIVI